MLCDAVPPANGESAARRHHQPALLPWAHQTAARPIAAAVGSVNLDGARAQGDAEGGEHGWSELPPARMKAQGARGSSSRRRRVQPKRVAWQRNGGVRRHGRVGGAVPTATDGAQTGSGLAQQKASDRRAAASQTGFHFLSALSCLGPSPGPSRSLQVPTYLIPGGSEPKSAAPVTTSSAFFFPVFASLARLSKTSPPQRALAKLPQAPGRASEPPTAQTIASARETSGGKSRPAKRLWTPAACSRF